MTKESTSTNRTPSHVVYHVRDRTDSEKGHWTRIGAAWPHADGNGFNAELACVPMDGRIVLRVASDSQS